ncbi:MAG: hypothetical protein RLZZ507_3533 [Cyanobacteriota bacterium]|jgi:hypothetical protein
MRKLNNTKLVALLVGCIGLPFAVLDEECRSPYLEKVLPSVLITYVKKDDDSNPPSHSEKKVKDKEKR